MVKTSLLILDLTVALTLASLASLGYGFVAWATGGMSVVVVLAAFTGLLLCAALGYLHLVIGLSTDSRNSVDAGQAALEWGFVCAPLVLPAAAAVVVSSSTGDWRWAATGFVAGAFLPAVIVCAAVYFCVDDVDSGIPLVLLLALAAGPLVLVWRADVTSGSTAVVMLCCTLLALFVAAAALWNAFRH